MRQLPCSCLVQQSVLGPRSNLQLCEGLYPSGKVDTAAVLKQTPGFGCKSHALLSPTHTSLVMSVPLCMLRACVHVAKPKPSPLRVCPAVYCCVGLVGATIPPCLKAWCTRAYGAMNPSGCMARQGHSLLLCRPSMLCWASNTRKAGKEHLRVFRIFFSDFRIFRLSVFFWQSSLCRSVWQGSASVPQGSRLSRMGLVNHMCATVRVRA